MVDRAKDQSERLRRASLLPRPEPPPDPVFTPKYNWDHIPPDFAMEDYGDKFWDQMEVVNIPELPESWVDADVLETIAVESAFPEVDELKFITKMLREGADTGVTGAARMAQEARNSPKVALYGLRVMDTIRSWLEKKIICGPFKDAPDDAKCSPLGVVIKPTAEARVLVDLSYPHLENPDVDGNTPISFNAGIDKKQFKTMSATVADVLEKLHRVGERALIAKIDWADAYKHVKVRPQDIRLQYVKIGGRFLVDTALTFGASSSPGLFDRLAELVLKLALHIAKLPRELAVRQLDDNVLIGEPEEVWRGYFAFNSLAKKIGVRTSPEVKGKAFPPQSHGAVLGFNFHAPTWTWSMDTEKAIKILRLLFKVKDGEANQAELDTLIGKIGFYWPLFKGQYERTFLFLAQQQKAPRIKKVVLFPQLLSQVNWWIRTIRAAMDKNHNMPDPRGIFPSSFLAVYPDAAGGVGPAGSGFGAVLWLETRHWVAHFWPPAIRNNEELDIGANIPAQRIGYHTMILEAIAALAGLLIWPERVRNSNVVIYCDNSAVVDGYFKGHSTETLAQCVIKACVDVAEGLNIKLDIRKVPRCSAPGPTAADLLSKGKLDQALEVMETPAVSPGYLSRTLMAWVERPVVTRTLGHAILRELELIGVPVLSWQAEDESEINELVRLPAEYKYYL